jgi:hypothetical protein
MFMDSWSDLYPDDTQALIKKGVQAMIQGTIKILGKPKEAQGPRLMLMPEQGMIRKRMKLVIRGEPDRAGRGCCLTKES